MTDHDLKRRVQLRMAEDHIPTGTDDPDLIAQGARTMSELRCPGCGSTDVWCEETGDVHRHGCNACLRIDTFKEKRK